MSDVTSANPRTPAAPEPVQPSSYVGFDTITSQIEHRLLKRGFQFNVLVAGHSGLGKSTLVNSLFATDLVQSQGRKEAAALEDLLTKTTEISVTSHQLLENNVRLNINVIDTPGFGDHINNEKCVDPIIKYIKDQYSTHLRKELTANRERHIQDSRVHAVLYFIQPNNYGLKALDVIALKKLSEMVNVIPVIAKADALTLDERENFRRILQEEFKQLNLNLYPYDSEEYFPEEKALNDSIRSIIPFAIIGSNTLITGENGEVFRGRRTKWGNINIEDSNQSEFTYLRDFLTRTHLQDLIDSTAFVHYESFRSKQLTSLKEQVGHKEAANSGNSSNSSNSNNNASNPSTRAAQAPAQTFSQPAAPANNVPATFNPPQLPQQSTFHQTPIPLNVGGQGKSTSTTTGTGFNPAAPFSIPGIPNGFNAFPGMPVNQNNGNN
ncbi:hypothetical protein WICPIJ_001637 [Wickerhamomyces pijperi]|uniref:Cell division control protein 10 n=1 Tax=Wickerhamomyces pijperi TaxID=599730 RepID=A0A9P8QCV7_WICPI|nr:hypothetical protein WICPIJ_001637 [Wickerhamomyces pijperi]